MSIISIVFYVLIIFMVISSIKEIPQRIRNLKHGKKALLYLFLTIPILLVTLIGSIIVSEYIPILKLGWLGYNIIFGPSLNSNTETTTLLSIIPTLSIFIFAMFACLIFNYYEEKEFRKKWIHVPLWAVLHLIMGIPIYAIIPIFSVGIIYKHIYDKYSLDHAYTAHFATNIVIIGIVIVSLIYSVVT